MYKVKITLIRKTCYPDLMAQYENPISHACDYEEGMVWYSTGRAPLSRISWVSQPEAFMNWVRAPTGPKLLSWNMT